MFSYFIGGVGGAGAAKQYGGTAIAFNLMIFAGTGLLYALHMSRARHITLLKAIFLRADVRHTEKDLRVEVPTHDAQDSVENPMTVEIDPSFQDKNGGTPTSMDNDIESAHRNGIYNNEV